MNKKNNMILTLMVILAIVAAGTGAYFYMIGQTHAVEVVEVLATEKDNPITTENEILEILEIVGRDQNNTTITTNVTVPSGEGKRVYYCDVPDVNGNPIKLTREECIKMVIGKTDYTREEAIRVIDSTPQYDYKNRVIEFVKDEDTIYVTTKRTI